MLKQSLHKNFFTGFILLAFAHSSAFSNSSECATKFSSFSQCVKYKSSDSDSAPKQWTFMIYIAADNDLFYFAWNNIRQMARGANPNVNIVVLLNEPGTHKKTQVYLIEKNKATLLNQDNQEKLDSGSPQTLIDFCTWTIKNFPAEEYMLDLWNHGTGIACEYYRAINPTSLFVLNPSTLMLELDRNIRYLDMIKDTQREKQNRGICFDDTYKTYLNNQDLEHAMSSICNNALGGKKISIIGMDACLMSMVEVANIFKKHASIMVSSQEVELGQGWRYDWLLRPLTKGRASKEELSASMVNSYHDAYSSITSDFTLSAIDLERVSALEGNINQVASILIECFHSQSGQSVKHVLRQCRRNICFEEPSYIDLGSFYKKLQRGLKKFVLEKNEHLKNQLAKALGEGLVLLDNCVIENTRGSNLSHANGLSIYFPEQGMIGSYQRTEFAQANQWNNFITYYTTI